MDRPTGHAARCLAYLCQSPIQGDQDGRRAVEAHCEAHGLPEAVWHIDTARDWWEPPGRRPDLRRLVLAARPGDVAVLAPMPWLNLGAKGLCWVAAGLPKGVRLHLVAHDVDFACPEARLVLDWWQEGQSVANRARAERMRQQGRLANGFAPRVFGWSVRAAGGRQFETGNNEACCGGSRPCARTD